MAVKKYVPFIAMRRRRPHRWHVSTVRVGPLAVKIHSWLMVGS
jgi:hypothetical protein